MNKDELYELLGDIDENAVKEAEKPIRRKGKLPMKIITAAACLLLAVGIGTRYLPVPDIDGDTEQSETTAGNDSDGASTNVNKLLAAAKYPECPPYPEEPAEYTDEYEQMYIAWSDAMGKRRKSITKEDKDSFNSFFSKTSKVFLSDSKSDNCIYSPLSLYMALGMSAEISDGNTRQQILDVMGQKDISSLRTNTQNIWNAHYVDDGMAKCVLASSLWTNSNFSYDQNTLDRLAKDYYASSYTGVPGSEEYDKMLQNWLNGQTDGLLDGYVSNINMSPETVLALASTVNFSGKWNSEFSPERTESGMFHSSKGDVECDFMTAEWDMFYFWGEKFASINLSMENNGYMRLILPDEGYTPNDLVNDSEVMKYMMSSRNYKNGKYVTVDMKIPKFDVSSNIDLCNGLKELGITDAFDPSVSDFSPLTDTSAGIAIGRAEQDTRVIIDEKGCRAAALTVMMYDGAALPEDNAKFILDRPFIFEIMSETGLPLFVGIVNVPV